MSSVDVNFLQINIAYFDIKFCIHSFTSDPDPPSDLQVFGQEENTVYFSWKLPRGGFDMFQVR